MPSERSAKSAIVVPAVVVATITAQYRNGWNDLTGFSSLSYLKRFPFDKIKIDRCFVSDIEVDGSAAIVQAVVNIAAARNMTTTAEGVETEQQREILRRLGCTQMQGYLFSAAKPASQIRTMLGIASERTLASA